MKDIQCYELFGGIAIKNHAFSFSYRNLLLVRTFTRWNSFSPTNLHWSSHKDFVQHICKHVVVEQWSNGWDTKEEKSI